MNINPERTSPTRVMKLLPFALLAGALFVSACGLGGLNRSAPTGQSTPEDSPPGVAVATALSNGDKAARNPKCDALFLANNDMGMALAAMVNLTADTNYSAYTDPTSPFFLNFKKIRSDLDTLATLPDPSAADALIVGKPSEAILYFHQLADLAETDIKNQGKPFVDTSPDGVKLIGIDTPWEQHAAVFGVAMGNVCKGYTAPPDLLAGTPAATADPQLQLTNDSTMATAAAAGAEMEATVNAAATAFPEPTETPQP